jgi:hypothetical protein
VKKLEETQKEITEQGEAEAEAHQGLDRQKDCTRGPNCEYLNSRDRCNYKHSPEEIAAAARFRPCRYGNMCRYVIDNASCPYNHGTYQKHSAPVASTASAVSAAPVTSAVLKVVEVDSKGVELIKTSSSPLDSTLVASVVEVTELRVEVSKIEQQLINMQKEMEKMIKARKSLLSRIETLSSSR